MALYLQPLRGFPCFLITELIHLLFVIKVSHGLGNTNTRSQHKHLDHLGLHAIADSCFIFRHPSPFQPFYIITVTRKVHPQISHEIPVPPGSQLTSLPCGYASGASQTHAVSLVYLPFHFRQLPLVSPQHCSSHPRCHHGAFYLRIWPIPSHFFTS